MMTLYSRATDARCHRVRLVLAEKALETRVVETEPASPPEDLIDLNPYQTVPTLVDRELVVYEPGIVCEYIDERFPHPSLSSTDPGARAHARLALRRTPELNGLYRDGEFTPSAAVHAGVAISLRGGGLVAPALHDVATTPLEALMVCLSDLVRRARAGSLRSSEMSDPTITVTNLGDQGVESAFGVIYPPQVALVGFGRITQRAWAQDGWLTPMPVVTASLAADHRVSDGHRGALFLAELRDRLQQPDTLDAPRSTSAAAPERPQPASQG